MQPGGASDDRWGLFELHPDPVVVANGEGRVVYLNEPGRQLIGAHGLHDVVGRHVLEFVHPDDIGRALQAIASNQDHFGAHPVIEMRFMRLDGAAVRMEVNARTLPDGTAVFAGRHAGALASMDRFADASADRLRRLIHESNDAILLVDGDGRVEMTSNAISRVLGLDPHLVVGEQFEALFGQPDLLQPGATASGTPKARVDMPDGRAILVGVVDCRHEASVGGWIVTMADVTALSEAESALDRSEQLSRRLEALLDGTSDLVAICALDGTVSYQNPALMLRLEGGARIQQLLGAGRWERDVLPMLLVQGSWQGEVDAEHAGAPVELSVVCTLQEGPSGLPASVSLVARDIALLKHAQRELKHAAVRDHLTGLLNRRGLEDEIARLGAQGPFPMAALLVDLDRFKPVNDSYGHDTGDEVLRCCALRLGSVVRAGDRIARVGGDEFVVLMPGCDAGEANRVAHRASEVIAAPMAMPVGTIEVGASVGVAVVSMKGELGALLRRADEAMYAVKRGRGPTRAG
jgi:diguanylate cyclase (GGDEF)-like protein/PAS domain S-box-containing protein